METVLTQSSAEVQSFSAHKQITNRKKTIRSFVSKPSSENIHRRLALAPPPPPSRSLSYSHPPSLALHGYNNIHRSLSLAPPPPPSRSLSNSHPPSLALHSYNNIQQPAPQLLPLPVSKLRHNSLPSPSRKATRARDQSLTPKKSKQPTTRRSEESTTTTKQDYTKPVEKTIAEKQALLSSESLMVAATLNPLGPDPNDLPKDVSKVLCAGIVAVHNNKDFEKFSGSVFTISPPPSSLPLPKFSMKPKQLISCNAEAAAGIDAGATDNIRRLLRLR